MTLILLVEDDQNLRQALEALISGDGYKVHAATNGEEALAEVERERPDIIVSDVTMPTMDGETFVRLLLAIPVLSSIPVVMTSAASSRPELPIHTFLRKPFSATTLLEVLRHLQPP
ncbi:response regulator [Paraburkholderia sp. DHOC27]|uniref:response regulator n=1 Tax=Paraburkholderia sp. DHOC27 TaxID=2303330 RepID=UPI000E3DD5B7|nr:response regulator [Paraburkholderia sp. DHOC27]RFU44488.1 response regulator [Paraburkholderia sp. DHOC27]